MNYICDKCGAGFQYPSMLARHQRRKTSCVYYCMTCNKPFFSKTKLQTHTKQCTSKNPCVNDEEFYCTYCQKNYANKYNLKNHMVLCSKSANYQLVIQENKELRERLKKLEKRVDDVSIKSGNTYVQQTFNGPVTNTINNYNVVIFGEEPIDAIDVNVVRAILSSGDKIRIEYLKNIHANPELPELRNIKYIPSLNQFKVIGVKSDGSKNWLLEEEQNVHSMLNNNVKRFAMKKNNEMIGQSDDIDKTLFLINSQPEMPKVKEEESNAYKEVLATNSELD